jgi:hypothetical protein
MSPMSQPRSARHSDANTPAHIKSELVVEPTGYERADLARHAQLLRAYRAEVASNERARALSVNENALSDERRAAYFSRRVPRPIFLARSERARA